MELSFIIPYIYDYPAIIHTVNSIQAEMLDRGLKYEIIIVENGEIHPYTENFKKFYRTPMKQRLIRYFFEPQQCGPAARMKGIREAKGKYIVTMDSHTELGRDSILQMINTFEMKDAGIVHGTTVKTHWVSQKGAHYRLFGNTGQNLHTQFQGAYNKAKQNTPYKCVGANLAYILQDREEMLKIGGYHPKCRYQPHPEGYLPLKYLMFGRQPWIDPVAYHFHSVYRAPPNVIKALGFEPRKFWEIEIDGDSYEMVGQDHLICNSMMCAYTLGGEKWLEILYTNWYNRIRSKYVLNGIMKHAKTEAQEERSFILDNAEKTLDEVLTEARKERIQGMENWYPPIGDDPIIV